MTLQHALASALRATLFAAFAFATAAATTAAPLNLCATPDGSGGCYAGIQAAIDAAQPGATIDVFPGRYHEVAASRAVAGLKGAHQFGLFIDKHDLTIRGVDAEGNAVARWSDVQTEITTDATNAFGPSAVFVQGDGVTLSGLGLAANDSGLNKTIEVTGDRFALIASDITDLMGSVYINDFRYDAALGTSHVRAYRIEGNNFRDGVSIDIASGAGVSGPLAGRVIAGNTFANSKAFPSISFNGAGTGIQWFAHPVGGAIIEGNVFINTFASTDAGSLLRAGHIAVRGLVIDRAQLDWSSYLASNVFNQAYATGPAPDRLRSFALSMPEWNACGGATCAFDMARIGATLEGEAPIAFAGDITLGRSGTLAPQVFDTD